MAELLCGFPISDLHKAEHADWPRGMCVCVYVCAYMFYNMSAHFKV